MTEPREGKWFAEPRPVRRTLRKIPSWPIVLWAPAAMFRINNAQVLPTWMRLAEAAGWISVAVLGFWWNLAELAALRATESDRRFSDHPPGLQEFPMEIVILRDDKEVGMDRGFAWFDNGLFCFNGTATSFALSSADFYPRRRFKIGNDEPRDCAFLRIGRLRAAIRLLPLRGWRRYRFWYRFGRFLTEPPNRGAGRQWPPMWPYRAEPSPTPVLPGTPESIGMEAARTGSATGVIRT